MVSLKQELGVLDYFGPLCVFVSFFIIVFVISVTCILWFCVSETDDVNVFTKHIKIRVASYQSCLTNCSMRLTQTKNALKVFRIGGRRRNYEVRRDQNR